MFVYCVGAVSVEIHKDGKIRIEEQEGREKMDDGRVRDNEG